MSTNALSPTPIASLWYNLPRQPQSFLFANADSFDRNRFSYLLFLDHPIAYTRRFLCQLMFQLQNQRRFLLSPVIRNKIFVFLNGKIMRTPNDGNMLEVATSENIFPYHGSDQKVGSLTSTEHISIYFQFDRFFQCYRKSYP